MTSASYKVGYKRPPQQHQFKKGASGNPKGRPRKDPARPHTTAHAELDDILLKEALRPIAIRENDQVIEIPMIQAVLRSLGVAAVSRSTSTSPTRLFLARTFGAGQGLTFGNGGHRIGGSRR